MPRQPGLRYLLAAACAVIGLATVAAHPASAADKKLTVAYIAPSLDISYWQWVAYGAKTKAAEARHELCRVHV